jgi:hypothetical protein
VSDDAAAPQKFERIIFNFPHTGQQMAHVNRAMIRNFFASAVGLLDSETSEIHVTLKLKFPYTSWDTETSATAAGLVLTDTLDFDAAVFPGYTHRTTRKDATAAGVKDKDKRHCKTFVYRKDPSGVRCNISTLQHFYFATCYLADPFLPQATPLMLLPRHGMVVGWRCPPVSRRNHNQLAS